MNDQAPHPEKLFEISPDDPFEISISPSQKGIGEAIAATVHFTFCGGDVAFEPDGHVTITPPNYLANQAAADVWGALKRLAKRVEREETVREEIAKIRAEYIGITDVIKQAHDVRVTELLQHTNELLQKYRDQKARADGLEAALLASALVNAKLAEALKGRQ